MSLCERCQSCRALGFDGQELMITCGFFTVSASGLAEYSVRVVPAQEACSNYRARK